MARRRRKREPVWAVLLAAILIGACEDPVDPAREALALKSTPSPAAVPGLGLHWASSGHSSVNKSAVVACPEGQSVLGLGGRTRGGNGQIVMDALIPKGPLPGGGDVTVHASEVGNGTLEEWSVVAYAICANVPTNEVARLDLPPSSQSPREREIGISDNPCSLNNKVLSGVGAEIVDGPPGQIVLDAMIPSEDLEGSTARAAEHPPGTLETWGLEPTAICAELSGLERVVRTSQNTSDNKHVTVRCPEGTRVVGTGGEIIGGQGQVVITYVIPDRDLTRVHVRGAEDEDGTTAEWAVRAYAICAPS